MHKLAQKPLSVVSLRDLVDEVGTKIKEQKGYIYIAGMRENTPIH